MPQCHRPSQPTRYWVMARPNRPGPHVVARHLPYRWVAPVRPRPGQGRPLPISHRKINSFPPSTPSPRAQPGDASAGSLDLLDPLQVRLSRRQVTVPLTQSWPVSQAVHRVPAAGTRQHSRIGHRARSPICHDAIHVRTMSCLQLQPRNFPDRASEMVVLLARRWVGRGGKGGRGASFVPGRWRRYIIPLDHPNMLFSTPPLLSDSISARGLPAGRARTRHQARFGSRVQVPQPPMS